MKTKQLRKRKAVLKASELGKKLIWLWGEFGRKRELPSPAEWKIERRKLRMEDIKEARSVRKEMLKLSSPVK